MVGGGSGLVNSFISTRTVCGRLEAMSQRFVLDEISDLQDQIEQQMRSVVERRGHVAPLFREMVNHHLGWISSRDKATQTKGKRVRPLITLLVGKALGANDQALLATGAAVELIHNFTLIHDDIMDNSLERRHRPTVWSIWGVGQAINAGDGLYGLGYLSALDLMNVLTDSGRHVVADVVLALTQACLDTAEGQILDVSFEKRTDVSVDEYITMVSNKSASLIECAARCGALVSTNDQNVVEAYARFGRTVGIAFQIRDDYLGIWGDETITGKPTGTDIVERKKSLPVIQGFGSATGEDRSRLLNVYSKELPDDTDVTIVQDILVRLGADAQTERLATQYYEDAMSELASTGIDNQWQIKLRSLARFLVERSI